MQMSLKYPYLELAGGIIIKSSGAQTNNKASAHSLKIRSVDIGDDEFGGLETLLVDKSPCAEGSTSDGDEMDTESEDASDSYGADSHDDDNCKDNVDSMKLEDLLSAMHSRQQESVGDACSGDGESTVSGLHEMLSANSTMLMKKFLVCGICLESEETYADEIIACDKCGITVHEGCYGEINGDEAIVEDSCSDGPTEPWFCEPCKAGLSGSPMCELCPNIGGIYKMSDTGKWVHLVCALYTPFVGFRDTIKLETAVLEDIKVQMWGGKECTLCEDENFAQTGVCITCDHGLCKTTFHVTCALRNGLLSDIPAHGEVDPQTAEFLYAHCKLHADKLVVNQRKASLLTYLNHVDKFKLTENKDELERVDVALEKAKKSFREFRRSVVPPKPSLEPFARLLSSCPEACIKLARKAEILGISSMPEYDVSSAIIRGSVRKHEPNLSSDFVAYFYRREKQIKDLLLSLPRLEPVLQKLQQQQKKLTKLSEDFQGRLTHETSRRDSLTSEFMQLHESLCGLAGRKFGLPVLWKAKKSESLQEKLTESSQLLSTIVHQCFACQSTSDQHLMIQCDTCLKYNHLSCLDPPLSRMPKKSKLYKWQCTNCDSSEDDSGNEMSDEGIKRKKRVSVKPIKLCYNGKGQTSKGPSDQDNEKTGKKRRHLNLEQVALKKKRTLGDNSNDVDSRGVKKESKILGIDHPTQASPPARARVGRRRNIIEVFDACDVCKEPGKADSMVRCDICKKCYHFATCLYPPYKKSPKSKFFQWICEDCDDSDVKPKVKDSEASSSNEHESVEESVSEVPTGVVDSVFEIKREDKACMASELRRAPCESIDICTSQTNDLVKPEGNVEICDVDDGSLEFSEKSGDGKNSENGSA